jgi:hypothetical protein
MNLFSLLAVIIDVVVVFIFTNTDETLLPTPRRASLVHSS